MRLDEIPGLFCDFLGFFPLILVISQLAKYKVQRLKI